MAKSKKSVKKPAKDMLVVTSKVKEHIKSKGFMTSGELPGKLSECVVAMLNAAMKRTEENRRKTVSAHDL